MRILISGGHSELIWDMVKVFHEKLGHDVDIVGGLPDCKRPPVPDYIRDYKRDLHEVLVGRISRYNERYNWFNMKQIMGLDKEAPSLEESLTEEERDAAKEIVEGYDLMYCFVPAWALIYSRYIPVVWHLIGGENAEHIQLISEVTNRGGKVVCYAEAQKELIESVTNRRKFSLDVVHFYKDPGEFGGWDGSEKSVLYVANSLRIRSKACHEEWFLKTRIEGKWWLAGYRNETYGTRARMFPYDEYKDQMKKSRLFFNLGTDPAPYTLAVIEAAMTGMPVVTPRYRHDPAHPRYQVPDLLRDGCFVLSNNKKIAKIQIRMLLNQRRKCSEIGSAARVNATLEFGSSVLKKWEEVLG